MTATAPLAERFTGLAGRLGGDAEFALTARLWSATVCLAVDGRDIAAVRVEHGAVVELDPAAPGDVDVRIAAAESTWAELLAPVPRPFFHDLFPAMVHHGVAVEGAPEVWWSQYRSLQRLLEILRGA